MIGHPDERRLLGFHEGRLPDGERRRIAVHLADCQRCRNVIQGHRAVRQVFQLEASPAPGGVLERVLATRASGGVMVLPVADPGHGRRVRGGAIAVIAGAAAVALLSVVQVIPMRPFAVAWDVWSDWAAEWRPFGTANGKVTFPAIGKAPIAKPAVLHPERLRAMTVTYRVIDRGPNRPPRVDTSGFSLLAPEPDHREWQLRSFPVDSRLGDAPVYLDPRTLRPSRWKVVSGAPDTWLREYAYHLVGDRITVTLRYSGDPPERFVERDPPSTQRWPVLSRENSVIVLNEFHLFAAWLSIEFTGDWAGSFAFMRGRGPGGYATRVTSYYITGMDSVTTPAGTFQAWQLGSVGEYGSSSERWWLRTSDGLMVKSEWAAGSEYRDTRELLSITYP